MKKTTIGKTRKTIIRLLALCLAVFTIVSLASCGKKDPDTPEGTVNIAKSDAGYSFFVPTTWKADTEQQTPSAYYSNNDASNVSLMAFSLEHSDETVDDWWKSFEEDFTSVYSGYELISEEETVFGGCAAVRKVFKGTLGDMEYKFMQVSAIKRETLSAPQVFVFTYTSIPSVYDEHLDDVNAMTENFTFN